MISYRPKMGHMSVTRTCQRKLRLKSLLSGRHHCYSLLVFLVWTVTSFLCHYCANHFLVSQSDEETLSLGTVGYGIHNAGLLTSVQIVLCLIFVHVDTGSSSTLRIARVTHVLATLATNISMAMMYASSTFAIKLMEPITSAVIQYYTLVTPLSPLSIMSLPVIVGGAIIFTGNPFSEATLSLGTLAALASNIILSFRNVALKIKTNEPTKKMALRFIDLKTASFILMCVTCMLYLDTAGYLGPNTSYKALMCLLSGVFHVLYSFVSTGMVLTQMSVVSHAVANIMKRVMVVLLLYMFGRRVATAENFLGLGICTVGLFIYAWDKGREKSETAEIKIFKRSNLKYLSIVGFILIAFITYTLTSRPERPGTVSSRTPVQTRDRFDFTFTQDAFKIPGRRDLEPDLTDSSTDSIFRKFINETDREQPPNVNILSKEQKTHIGVIKEAQRLHFDILGNELKKYKYAVLLDIASFENKGDPCITIGEIYFLARINLKIIYYCNFFACTKRNMEKAKKLVSNYTTKELVILVHGGGNLVGYAQNDILRFRFLEYFAGYKMFVFPQSVWIRNFKQPHLKRCAEKYCCNENITLVLRDKQSYEYAQKYFSGKSKKLMAPDMAFQIGSMARFVSPVFDIMWIKRKDGETPGYKNISNPPSGIRVHVSDWWSWKTPPAGTSLEKAFYICTNGFFYLQRGRVIVTDRLHGHILATLMNIPHVLIDNKAKKLSSYHNTWTRNVENTVITDDPSKAMDLAINLLDKYKDILPPRVPYLDIAENFKKIRFEKLDKTYT